MSSDLLKLLSSLSSEVSDKILKLYSTNQEGLNLTDTAREINEKTSTVKDYLNKLLASNLIYKKDKIYRLSNFGSYILDSLDKLEIFNNTREIFGQIPAEIIPSEFLQEFIPNLRNIQIQSDEWQIILASGDILNKINENLGKGSNYLKLVGWNKSLSISLEIIQRQLPNISFENDMLVQFLKEFNFQYITDKAILNEIKQDETLRVLIEDDFTQERICICENIEQFKFTLFRYNDIIQFFLNEEQKHFLIEANEGAINFFENVFNFYLKKSKPLSHYL